MEGANKTAVSEFILLGLSTIEDHLQAFIFLLLFIMYLVTLLGNTLVIFIVWVDHRLHTPMYFFISNFSFLEILFTSVTNPKMLLNFITDRKTINFAMCMAQSYFYFAVGATEFAILMVMSFDRYVAICCPLQYVTIMRPRLCVQLVLGSWVGGFSVISLHMVMMSKLRFCGPNVINHFFCDSTPLFQLSCVDTHLIQKMDAILLSTIMFSSLCLTMVSYSCLLFSILRIPSTVGRKKAFATCTSHLMVVSLAYGSCIFMYARPVTGYALDLNKGVAVLNTILTPFLNPFIYTFRNKNVKLALRDAINHRIAKLSPIF
ncbi:olfactory receptor 6E1-like [Alligator mississippiensis]|uniref:olfactory receptor 6E1-like n=1 Tax=Alligator mississippiensis TaxID=8496 RepID=UPI00287738FB|nr:olfactory receptor 6E1-like [Alligator mississippiensis]